METSNPAVAERLRNASCLSVVCFNSTIRQAQSSIRISYFRFRFTAVYNKLLTPAPVQLQGHVVESTDCFTYLGSDIHSSERSTPEILRRIGLASNIFGRLANIWKRTELSLQTKIRLYNALVISVLLYGSETWTLLKADERRLEALIANDGS